MKNNTVKLIILLLIVTFISIYAISESGYYEYKLQEKTILTNEKIKEFEADVKNNENVDIKEYLDYKELDYSNKITNLVYEISDNSNKLTRKLIKAIFNKLSTLVEE